MEDSAQRRWSGAVRGAIRDIGGGAGLKMQRGWSSFADTRQIIFFQNNRRGSAIQIFSRGSVSAEMAIRSAARGSSTNFGFKEGDLSCFCSARAEMRCGEGGALGVLRNKSDLGAFVGVVLLLKSDRSILLLYACKKSANGKYQNLLVNRITGHIGAIERHMFQK